MKPVSATISGNIADGSIFLFREINQSYFDSEFHFHEECQLAYIIKGKGKRIVGDSVDQFEEDELVFIGSNIPHVWYNNKSDAPASQLALSVSLSLFISPKRFIEHLTAFGEIQKIEQLFEKAKRGMLITGLAKTKLVKLINKASKNHGIPHIIMLFEIIHILSTTTDFTFLASAGYINNFQYRDNERMDRVYKYLVENFKSDILLNDVAAVAGMNPNAFCRFFKARTQKSCVNFINEIRVGYATKLLADRNESITRIAYQCGFNNVSNFNRSFKIVKRVSPRQYRKELELN